MTEWQPIETAPKDGTDILLAGWYDGDCRAHVTAFWHQDSFHSNGSQIDISEWRPIALPDSQFSDFEPTHWQPLSPPPEPRP